MRFLFGLIIGAVATVMLAPKFGSLSPATFAPIGEKLQAVASHVAEVSPAADAVEIPAADAIAALPERATDALPLPKLAAAPAVTTTPSEPKPAVFAAPILTELSQEQSVWVPFRSEISARGFAGKLTEQLERPFQVLRGGPGQYLVVFGYQDEAERAEVLAEINALTGYTHL